MYWLASCCQTSEVLLAGASCAAGNESEVNVCAQSLNEPISISWLAGWFVG
jgi:hypothetical protein